MVQCTLDNNCCSGMECSVAAVREGVTYTCQPAGTGARTMEDEAEDDIRWGFESRDSTSSEETKYVLRNMYRGRLEDTKKQEQLLRSDPKYSIKVNQPYSACQYGQRGFPSPMLVCICSCVQCIPIETRNCTQARCGMRRESSHSPHRASS